MIYEESVMDLVDGLHQAFALFRGFIEYMPALIDSYQIIFYQELQVGIDSSEIEVCLIYYPGLAGTCYAYFQDFRDDFISISFHAILHS